MAPSAPPPPSLRHILSVGPVCSRRMCPAAPWKLRSVSLVQLVNDGPFWLNIQFPFINHVFLDCQFSAMITEPFHADVHRRLPEKDPGPRLHLRFPRDPFAPPPAQ